MKYFFDENFSPKLARAINELDAYNEVLSTVDEFGRGLPDEELIPKIGQLEGILITQDFKIQKTQQLYQLYQDHSVGVFFFKFISGSKLWDINVGAIKLWLKLTNLAEKTHPPFGYRVMVNRGKFNQL